MSKSQDDVIRCLLNRVELLDTALTLSCMDNCKGKVPALSQLQHSKKYYVSVAKYYVETKNKTGESLLEIIYNK